MQLTAWDNDLNQANWEYTARDDLGRFGTGRHRYIPLEVSVGKSRLKQWEAVEKRDISHLKKDPACYFRTGSRTRRHQAQPPSETRPQAPPRLQKEQYLGTTFKTT